MKLQLALATLLLAPSLYAISTNPDVPVGSLSVDRSVVLEGGKPNLKWNVVYPQTVLDLVNITKSGGRDIVSIKKPVDLTVKIIGASVSDQYGNWYPVTTHIKTSRTDWVYLDSIAQPQVNASYVYWGTKLYTGDTISVKGKLELNGYKEYTSDHKNVIVLKDGDSLPDAYQFANQDKYEDFIKPYIQNDRITLGPNELIYLMELTHEEEKYADRQDAVLLIQLKEKNNNGHGNNIDGYDSSNPGNKPGVDSNPLVDDERIVSGGKRKRKRNR